MSEVLQKVEQIAKMAGIVGQTNGDLIGYGFDLGAGRTQLVFAADMKEQTRDGMNVVCFFSACQKLGKGFLSGLSKSQALELLRRNGGIPFGSFCIMSLGGEEFLCVKSTQILETMEVEEFRAHLGYVAHLADAREKELGRDDF